MYISGISQCSLQSTIGILQISQFESANVKKRSSLNLGFTAFTYIVKCHEKPDRSCTDINCKHLIQIVSEMLKYVSRNCSLDLAVKVPLPVLMLS